MRLVPVLVAAVVSTAAVAPATAGGQAAADALRLLDVPYMPQSEALCGGAAVAMVMRFWGSTAVYAETFADLVTPAEGGIRGDDLAEAVRLRGWQARSFKGDAALVQAQLASRRPVIALIEDRPGRFHYVVIVGWSGGRVIAHDPARAPYRVYEEAAFLKAWSQTGFWSLLALPDAAAVVAEAAPSAPHRETPIENGCTSMVNEGVRLAGAGQMEEAQRLLEVTAETCPRDAGPWREIAGLHAVRGDWRSAAAMAREALAREPDDRHATRILATSLFVADEHDAALDAWNRLGEPVIDLVNVTGLERTRYRVAAQVLGLEPQTVLTAPAIRQARRRLAEMPAAITSRVFYTPLEGGRAQVNAVIVERPFLPSGMLPLAALAGRAVTDREVLINVAGPAGGGEVIGASWRWWERRPRVAVTFSAPSPSERFGSVWRLEVYTERQTYRADALQEQRRGAVFTVADWASSTLRWEGSAGFDRWGERGPALSIGGALEKRMMSDRLTLAARGSMWAGELRAALLTLQADWQSPPRYVNQQWVARAGIDAASRSAPLGVWPGAGTGHGRPILLRGHPLLDEGIIRDGVFGRTLAHGGAEWRRWMQPGSRPGRIAPAVFLDVARAGRRLPDFDGRLHADAGVGVRIALPATGVLRVDVGRGLRDGRTALSVGWVAK